MPVPSSIEIRGPLLEIFKDDKPHNLLINELLELISEKVSVELSEMSATEKTAFKNNTNDAIKYLLKNKLLRQPSKSTYLISKEGAEILADESNVIDADFWKNFEASKITPKTVAKVEEVPEEKNENQEIQEQNLEEPEVEDFPIGLEESEPESPEQEQQEESEIEETTQEQELEPELEAESEQPIEDDNDDGIFLETDETESEEIASEIETENENEESEPETEGETASDDDGIEIQDAENFEEAQNIPEVAEIQEETANEESEIEEIASENETENENEVIEEMNESDLEEMTTEAADEILEEGDDATATQEQEDDEAEIDEEENDEQNLSDSSIEDLIKQYNEKLADDVIERIEALHQDNFCMIVMDLLSKMGYRVFQTARYTNEAEGSDLIQGIILENKPGMNPIYIQARKLSTSKNVSKADMLDFVNALSDKGGKGMFVTIGKFSKSAEEVANDEGIMLVDGRKLAGLMISNNFCVNTEKVFEIKALDLDTFSDYEN
ncbi:MAG: restriction endonuclease [Synergistaceae bacterium]|nr:restriction endonuclease [Synergistaceae bacterium]